MALPPVSRVIGQPVVQISPYLSEIAHKKVEGIALSCFEAIAHWFLTVFSCFYPAYNNFYNGLLEQGSQISVNGSPRLSRTHSGNAQDDDEASTTNSAQKLEDQALVALFQMLKNEGLIFDRCHPAIDEGSLTPTAAAIRAWITENPIIYPEVNTDQRALDLFQDITLNQFPLPILPREINLFYNLQSLRIRNSKIIKFPDGFNPPELIYLSITHTPTAELPAGFNPPNLIILDCTGTHITTVPEGFAPIGLLSQTLGTPSVTEETAIAPPPAELDFEQMAKDQDLINVFHFGIREQIPLALRPKGTNTGDSTEDAVTIRTWMEENPSALDGVTVLHLDDLGISVLPPEINLLKNLEELHVHDLAFTELPDDFNPPKLRLLNLSDTSLRELPSSLNPLQLEELILMNTKLVALRSCFNLLPYLKKINLCYCPIKKLSVNFNPPQLLEFSIEGTGIKELPAGFAPPTCFATGGAASYGIFGPNDLLQTTLKL